MTAPVRQRAAPLGHAVGSMGRFGWPHDLVLGIRLAVGGGRTSWARLILGTIGVGMAATVLLVAASLGHILSDQAARTAVQQSNTTVVPGVAPLDYVFGGTQFRGTDINGWYVRATGPNSPVPPGIPRVPGPNEVVLSPALAQLLDSPAGALLRPRFPERVVGQIGEAGLVGPQDLSYYAGIPASELGGRNQVEHVYSFGDDEMGNRLANSAILALLVVGMVALLVPILIMISVSSRIAGAARERRLAALRLAGAGARQVRRIAAAEALVPAATGLVLGFALYLVFRQVTPHVQLFGVSVFTDDVVVTWPLLVLIVLLVPVLAVGSAMAALRRTVIEPLGVVRGGRPVHRRVWWRVGLVVLGAALLFGAGRLSVDNTYWIVLVALGASLLLIGVPVLLPFLLERGVARVRGGVPSWQLAIRRLQLDSGTPARVVGGVAVVLAGAIALQTIVAATAERLALPDTAQTADAGTYFVVTDGSLAGQVDDAIQRTGVARAVYPTTPIDVTTPGGGGFGSISVLSCAAIQHLSPVPCRDGDVFAQSNVYPALPHGTTLTTVLESDDGKTLPKAFGRWTVPAGVRPLASVSGAYLGSQLLVTPRAIAGVRLPPPADSRSLVQLDPNRPDAIEYLRNVVAGHPLRTFVESVVPVAELDADQKTFVSVRTGLLIGSLFTLALAGVSLLVLALEQVRERRRPLAMLSASGVPRAVLARSLLWQIAVPVGVGVVAAIATGLALAALVLRITRTNVVLAWADVGVFSAAAVVLVLLITASTLPALRNATRLAAMRTE
jgi:hypothetical protein